MTDNKDIVMSVEKNVCRHIRESGAESLLVAVSGGADSVALLTACARIASHSRLRIEAVNCNFHLRGAESDRDSHFTADLCRRLGVHVHVINYDVAAYISDHPGSSTEMACRELRYSDFFRIAEERNLDRTAVAHNLDDDIETMLLNMLRGSGSRGLKGIDIDNGKVLRPLLTTSRAEIVEYLGALGQDYITDSSNNSDEYRRNFIRLRVLPLLESKWPGTRKSLSKTLSIMKEESAIVERHYKKMLDSTRIDSHSAGVYSEDVSPGVILRMIEPFGGNSSIAHEIHDAVRRPYTRRTWPLGSGWVASLERDRLTIHETDIAMPSPELEWSRTEMSDETFRNVRSNTDHNIIYLPHGKDRYLLRKPQTGDRIAPLGMKGTRLVSDVIGEARLDNDARNAIMVLTRVSDGEIIWVAGLKRSRHDLISPKTSIIHKALFRASGYMPEDEH